MSSINNSNTAQPRILGSNQQQSSPTAKKGGGAEPGLKAGKVNGLSNPLAAAGDTLNGSLDRLEISPTVSPFGDILGQSFGRLGGSPALKPSTPSKPSSTGIIPGDTNPAVPGLPNTGSPSTKNTLPGKPPTGGNQAGFSALPGGPTLPGMGNPGTLDPNGGLNPGFGGDLSRPNNSIPNQGGIMNPGKLPPLPKEALGSLPPVPSDPIPPIPTQEDPTNTIPPFPVQDEVSDVSAVVDDDDPFTQIEQAVAKEMKKEEDDTDGPEIIDPGKNLVEKYNSMSPEEREKEMKKADDDQNKLTDGPDESPEEISERDLLGWLGQNPLINPTSDEERIEDSAGGLDALPNNQVLDPSPTHEAAGSLDEVTPPLITDQDPIDPD